MKILVTGIAGFIASHLAERLRSLGHEVVGIDCFTEFYPRVLKELNAEDVKKAGATIYPLDLATDDFSDACKGVEIIFHAAALPGVSEKDPFDLYVRNNITATYRLLEVARKLPNFKMFVFVSTSSVYGSQATDPEDAAAKPSSYYGDTKLCAEQLALGYFRDQGFPACSLRLFSIYGERERPDKLFPRVIRSILEDIPFPLYEGSEHHLRSFTYIQDVIDAFVTVLEHLDLVRGEIFNIGWDHEFTTGHAIQLLENILGKKANFTRVPKRAGDQLRTFANIKKARRILRYNPTTSLEVGLRKEAEWYKNRILGKVKW